MPAITRKTDHKGRVMLFGDFANHSVIVDRISDEEIRIRTAKAVLKRISLKELLAKITPENIHGEVATGPVVGREKS